MAEKTRVYLASDARGLSAAEGQGLPCVYLFYRVGDGGALQRAQLPAAARGGLMGVFEAPGLADADPPKLARDMAGECARRGYAGVFLDLAPAPQTVTPLAALSQELKRLRVVHYVPVSLLAAAPGARAVVPGAVSGGSFAALLDELCARWGADNVALDLQRMRSVFDMPSFSPEGRALPREEFDALLGRCRPSVFFSPELGCKYFTCRENGRAQFVLFDDADTAAYKLGLARQRNLPAVFLLWSEWGPLAKEIAK
jgi:hypothetical protein